MNSAIGMIHAPGKHFHQHMRYHHDILQVDNFAVYDWLFSVERYNGSLAEASFWSPSYSKIHNIYIRCQSVRQSQSKPLLAFLHEWLVEKNETLLTAVANRHRCCTRWSARAVWQCESGKMAALRHWTYPGLAVNPLGWSLLRKSIHRIGYMLTGRIRKIFRRSRKSSPPFTVVNYWRRWSCSIGLFIYSFCLMVLLYSLSTPVYLRPPPTRGHHIDLHSPLQFAIMANGLS